MARGNDFIIGKRGDSLRGKVLDKAFDITTLFGDVKIQTSKISWIHFRNPPQFPKDEIWLKNGDRLTGTVRQRHVDFRSEAGARLKIPREAIHTVIIDQQWNPRARPLR